MQSTVPLVMTPSRHLPHLLLRSLLKSYNNCRDNQTKEKIGGGKIANGLYYMDIPTSASVAVSTTWHQRFGHPPPSMMRLMLPDFPLDCSLEFLVKEGDRVELMAMLGLFGAIISSCQISILERNELRSIHWTAGSVLPFVGFALAMFVFYSTVPIILKISGSAMLNLSLLTSDMWAVLIRIFAYHEKVDWMYFISFGAVAVGLLVYSGGNKEGEEGTIEVAEANREVGKERDEEAAGGDLVQECCTIAGGSISLRNSDVRDQNSGPNTLSK